MNEEIPGAAPVTKLERLQYTLRHIWWATEVLEQCDDSALAMGFLYRARDALMEQLDDFYKHSDEPDNWNRILKWAEDHGKTVTIENKESEFQPSEK